MNLIENELRMNLMYIFLVTLLPRYIIKYSLAHINAKEGYSVEIYCD